MKHYIKRKVYSDYLQLDKVLSSQKLLSAEKGNPVHEEMLFIIIHQIYELWFKQILHDLDSIFMLFEESSKQNGDMELVLIRMQRINKILRLIIQQFEILETMSPLEFINFRGTLNSMSGFQSYQFRLFEIKFGLRREERMEYAKCPYDYDFKNGQKKEIDGLEHQLSLFDYVNRWLENAPFLKTATFDFKKKYKEAFDEMLKAEHTRIKNNSDLTEEDRRLLHVRFDEIVPTFDTIFDQSQYEELVKKGQRRLSYHAFLAAIFIRLYRRQPFLHVPDLLLTEVLDADALFTLWRYRHSVMVKKMIGWKMGTGGSSGVHYLQATVEKYSIFADLYLVPMLLIPEDFLPLLPKDLLPSINFFFNQKSRS